MSVKIRKIAWKSLLVAASIVLASSLAAQPQFISNGKAGFVLSHIEYALAEDAKDTGACPNGMTETYAGPLDVFVNQPQLKEVADDDNAVRQAYRLLRSDPKVKNLCMNPELGNPDPRFHIVTGPNVPVYGIDLDGHDTQAGDPATNTSCAHEDFPGIDGNNGVDNQFFRLMGCNPSFQSGGLANSFAIEMLTGSWGILVTLSGVDDIRNDDDVRVGFYSNEDPIRLSPGREPLPYATYSAEQDERFRTQTRGRISDGVLTTEPADLRFHWFVNSMRTERPLHNAVAQLTLSEDGVLEGYLAGYTYLDDLYNFMFGFRNATDTTGKLASLNLRAGSSIGKALVQGHTCEGGYYSLFEVADADPDPETGECTSLSVQYRIRAIPAFVIGAESANAVETAAR